MIDKLGERNRKRREKIAEHYKIRYCLPYCKAFVNNEESADDLLRKCLAFKEGVHMADIRYHKWQQRFNDIYHECMEIAYKERKQQC